MIGHDDDPSYIICMEAMYRGEMYFFFPARMVEMICPQQKKRSESCMEKFHAYYTSCPRGILPLYCNYITSVMIAGMCCHMQWLEVMVNGDTLPSP